MKNLRWLAAALPLLLLNTVPLMGQNQPPRPTFTWTADCDVVHFNASGSYDPDGSIATYHWDFGDGTGTTSTSPLVSHYYGYNQQYLDVTLWLTDDEGLDGEFYTFLNVGTFIYCD